MYCRPRIWNSTQTSTDCCTVVSKQFSYNSGVWVCYIQLTVYASVVYVVCSYVETGAVLVVADDDTTSAVSPTLRGGHDKTYGMRNCRRNVDVSLEVWMLWLGCLSITTAHGACDRPRCLRVVTSGIHAPHPPDLRGIIPKPPKPPIYFDFEHLKHLVPCRQRPLSPLE